MLRACQVRGARAQANGATSPPDQPDARREHDAATSSFAILPVTGLRRRRGSEA
jgi:hypothetical protein